MRYTTDWKDYELIDCSGGEKLERWGKQVLVRPDPQVIWKSKRADKLWFSPNARYQRSSSGGGEWQAFSHLPDASRGVVIHSRGYASLTPGYKPQLRLGLRSSRTIHLQFVRYPYRINLLDLCEIIKNLSACDFAP